MPAGACDSHMHVIPESGWTLVPGATYTPAAAPAEMLLRMLEALGLERGVVVQPSVFGTDNRAVVEAIACASQRLRGVAVVDPNITEEELQGLQAQGIRGVRFNLMLGGGGGLKAMTELAPRLGALGCTPRFWLTASFCPTLPRRCCSCPAGW